MKKLSILAVPFVLLLAGCGGSGGGGYGYNEGESISSGSSYAATPSTSSSSGQTYSTSRSGPPGFNNYPVNYNATVRTTCSDGSCQVTK